MANNFDWYSPTKTHTIQRITYNYFFGPENGEEFKEANAGVDHVEEIMEHRAGGEGDKWYYDILYDNGQVIRIFNPHEVIFTPKVL